MKFSKAGQLLLLAGVLIGSCARPTAATDELRFRPPRRGESIVVKQEFFADPDRNTIHIMRVAASGEEELFVVKPQTNFYAVAVLGQDTFYSLEDGDPDNGLYDLWKVDVQKGRIYDTGLKVGGLFVFSPDGRYICYEYSEHGRLFDWPSGASPTLWLFIPALRIRDMETGATTSYDFSTTFLREGWGALVEIAPHDDRFDVEFSIDGGTLGKGHVLLSDLRWYEEQ